MPDMNQNLVDTSQIPGWGVDADPQNDPTYPMRDRSREDGPGMAWARPPLQTPDVEILSSIEHNRLPAVVGTSTPPSGVSGAIRRTAFKYSESQWAHWLLLLLADRINVVEGVVADLRRGKVPNPFAEMGLAAELKYDQRAFIARSAATLAASALVVGAAWCLLQPRSRSRRTSHGRPRWVSPNS